MAELIQIQVSGLVAIYRTDDSDVTSRAPVVGYFKDEKGNLIAAVAGDGAKIVPANSVKGYRGLRWLETLHQVAESREIPWDGVSAFDRIFGRWWR
jgi:hypothetical protein